MSETECGALLCSALQSCGVRLRPPEWNTGLRPTESDTECRVLLPQAAVHHLGIMSDEGDRESLLVTEGSVPPVGHVTTASRSRKFPSDKRRPWSAHQNLRFTGGGGFGAGKSGTPPILVGGHETRGPSTPPTPGWLSTLKEALTRGKGVLKVEFPQVHTLPRIASSAQITDCAQPLTLVVSTPNC